MQGERSVAFVSGAGAALVLALVAFVAGAALVLVLVLALVAFVAGAVLVLVFVALVAQSCHTASLRAI